MVFEFLKKEQRFIYVIAIFVIIAAFIFNTPQLAMWFGFALAGYSSIANDSIQTLGTFLATNKKRPWWILWLFIGGILVLTNIYGYIADDAAVHFGRLESIPQPTSFTFLQLLSPIILIILTRMKMPVSTSFLLLSAFSSGKTIQGMLTKTFMGYIIAFIVAYILWTILAQWTKKIDKPSSRLWKIVPHRFFKKWRKNNVPPIWHILQWLATGFLWSQWLMQDTANLVVFLPRTLSFNQFLGFMIFLFIIIGYLMYIRGDKIQEIVTEKKDINNVRSATIILFVLGLILFYFKELNHLPMSTTWVFLGLLAGRELALTEDPHGSQQPYKRSLKLVGKDIIRALIGLAVSLALALFINNSL
ncbi:hypothetical protein KJ742_04605 [Patescibacteria group bacterium]|nr:hypothetical protein [Patescibacteria group bacterium]MBU1683199.1 hypothetical protein [Patescibacteria group bacterium]